MQVTDLNGGLTHGQNGLGTVVDQPAVQSEFFKGHGFDAVDGFDGTHKI